MKGCVYTFEGKEYSEQEFKALITKKIGKPSMEGVFNAFGMKVVKSSPKTEVKGEEKRFRGVIDALVNRSDIPQSQKDALTNDPDSYIKTLKVDEAVALVDKLLEEYGSIDALLQGVKSNDIPLDLQSIVYWKALNDAKANREAAESVEEKDKWADRENELLEEMGVKATSSGRFNAFINSFYQQSGYAMVRAAKKEIERRNSVFGKGAKKKAAEIKDVFDSTEHTSEALDEVVQNISSESIKAYEAEIEGLKKRLKELEKEPKKQSNNSRKRLVSKEAKDKAFKDLMKLSANPFLDPEFYKNITTISLYYIEDGYYTIEDFYKKMSKELKGKHKEFYGEAYKEARNRFNEDNPKATLSSDEEVDSFVENSLNEAEELRKEIARKEKELDVKKKTEAFGKILSASIEKPKDQRKTDVEKKLRSLADELDGEFGTTAFNEQVDIYMGLDKAQREAKSTERTVKAFNALFDVKDGSKSSANESRIDKMKKLAAELDKRGKTTAFSDRVAEFEKDERLAAKEKAIDSKARELSKMMSESVKTGKAKTDRDSKLRDLAQELDNFYKTNIYTKLVDDYTSDKAAAKVDEAKKRELAAKEKAFYSSLTESKKKKVDRKTLREKAEELDALFGTDVYTKQLDLYESQAKSVDKLINEGLIEAGYGKEVSTPNGGTKTIVDWAKVTGSSKSIEPIIDRLKKALEGKIDPTQLAQVLAVIEKQATKLIADKKTAAVQAKVKQLGRRKIGGLLNVVKRKTRIQNLLETWRRGGLTEKAILDQLASEFGIITFDAEAEAKIEEYIAKIDKAPIGAEREKLEEELQAFLNYQGSPIFSGKAFLEKMKTRILAGYSTFIQNSYIVQEPFVMMPFELLISQAQKGKITPNADIFRIVKKTFAESLANAADVLLRGGVDMGSSMSEVTGNKEGSPSVRYFENPRAKFKDNPSLYRKIQYYISLIDRIMPRATGFVETGAHVHLQNMRAYNFLRAQIASDNPNLSSKEINQMAFEAMYSVEMTDAVAQAEKEFKDRGIEIKGVTGRNRLNRRAFEIVQQARSKEVLREQQRYANDFTYKGYSFGFFSGSAWLFDQFARSIKGFVTKYQKSDSPTIVRIADTMTFFASFFTDVAVPFIKGLGLFMEKNMDFYWAYGASKAIALSGARALGIGKDLPMMDQRRAAETAYRAAVGFIVAQILYSLIDWEDEEKGIKKMYGEGSENMTEKINNTINRPKNTAVFGGRQVNFNYVPIAGMGLKVDAWLEDQKRYKDEDRTFLAAMLNIVLDTYTAKTGQMSNLAKDAMKSGDSDKAWNFIEDMAAELGTRALIPATNLVRQTGQMISPQAKKAVDFNERMLKYSGLNVFLDKPAFDYRGRSYEYGDANTSSLNGLVKSFIKKQPSDEIDNIIFEYNPAIMGIRKSDDLMTVWNEGTGEYEAVSDGDFYTITKNSADNFDELLRSWSRNFSYRKSDITPSKFEEIAREIENEEGRLITDKRELFEKVRKRFEEQNIAATEGVKTQIGKINKLAEQKAIYDYYVKNNLRIPYELRAAEKNYNDFIELYKSATSEQKARFLEGLE